MMDANRYKRKMRENGKKKDKKLEVARMAQ